MTRPHLLSFFVWLSALLLYALTAAPSIVALFDDTLEFQLVGPTWGIAHPTGYPLYVALGALWSRLLPLGSWAWRMNILNALLAATAVWLVFALAARLTAGDTPGSRVGAGLAAAAAYALSPLWWAQATVAEVYALHGLFVAALLSLALSCGEGAVNGAALRRRVTWLCLFVGLALAHHRTSLLLLPGLAIYLLWSVPELRRPQRSWLLWGAALTAPLLLYGLLPLRAAMGAGDLHGSYRNTWQGFWDHVLARGYAGFFADNPLAVERGPSDWLALLRAQFGSVALVAGLAGAAWLRPDIGRAFRGWVLVLITAAANLFFALNYRVSDAEVFLLPVFLCTALFIGGGVGLLERLPAQRRRLAVLGQVALIVLVVLGVRGRGEPVNRSRDWAAHDYAVALAKVDFPPTSRVIGLEGEMTALKYMQQAEALGRSAVPIAADDPERRRLLLDELVAAGYPTYLTRELDGIAERYSFSSHEPLVRVWPRGQAVVGPPQHTLDHSLADGALRIEGYDLAVLRGAGDPALRLALYWRPAAALAQDLKVSLRPLDAAGEGIADAEGIPLAMDAFPLRQVAPTHTWQPGELVRDEYTLTLSPAALEQAAALQIVVYDAATVGEVGRLQIGLPLL